MAIEKPAPLEIGGKYMYTLTSYDPVEVTIKVPRATKEEAHIEALHLAQEKGFEGDELSDAWVKDNIEDCDSVATLEEELMAEIQQLNQNYVERAKPSLCASKLAERLCQSVPEHVVTETANIMRQQFEMSLQAQGQSLDAFMSQVGLDETHLMALIAKDAKENAEQQAALDAYASEKKLKVDDTELPMLLGLSPKDANDLIKQAKEHNQIESLRQGALRNKALSIVASESTCTYEHETEEEAQKRIAHITQAQEEEKKREFKLVD